MLDRVVEIGNRLPHEDSDDDDNDGLVVWVLALAWTVAASSRALARCVL